MIGLSRLAVLPGRRRWWSILGRQGPKPTGLGPSFLTTLALELVQSQASDNVVKLAQLEDLARAKALVFKAYRYAVAAGSSDFATSSACRAAFTWVSCKATPEESDGKLSEP